MGLRKRLFTIGGVFIIKRIGVTFFLFVRSVEIIPIQMKLPRSNPTVQQRHTTKIPLKITGFIVTTILLNPFYGIKIRKSEIILEVWQIASLKKHPQFVSLALYTHRRPNHNTGKNLGYDTISWCWKEKRTDRKMKEKRSECLVYLMLGGAICPCSWKKYQTGVPDLSDCKAAERSKKFMLALWW